MEPSPLAIRASSSRDNGGSKTFGFPATGAVANGGAMARTSSDCAHLKTAAAAVAVKPT